jgi:hypothetical protein
MKGIITPNSHCAGKTVGRSLLRCSLIVAPLLALPIGILRKNARQAAGLFGLNETP